MKKCRNIKRGTNHDLGKPSDCVTQDKNNALALIEDFYSAHIDSVKPLVKLLKELKSQERKANKLVESAPSDVKKSYETLYRTCKRNKETVQRLIEEYQLQHEIRMKPFFDLVEGYKKQEEDAKKAVDDE